MAEALLQAKNLEAGYGAPVVGPLSFRVGADASSASSVESLRDASARQYQGATSATSSTIPQHISTLASKTSGL